MWEIVKEKYLLKAVKGETIFLLPIFYRWLLFLYAFFLFIFNVDVAPTYNLDALMVAFIFFYTLLVTIFFRKIFLLTKANYYLIILDVIVCFFLLYSSGGWGSQFYFYSFSPVFMAASLFELTGGFITAFMMCVFFSTALFLNGFTIEKIVYLNMTGDFLLFNFNYIVIALVFGYMSSLLNKVRTNTNFLNKLKENLSEDSLSLRDINNELSALLEACSAMQATTNLDSLTDLIVKIITREFDFDRTIIAFWDEENERFLNWKIFTKTDFNLEEKYLLDEAEWPSGLNSNLGKLLKEKNLRVIEDAENEPFINKELTSKLKISSYMISPLVHQNKLIGFMEADNFLSKKQITDFNKDLLECFLKVASISIYNTKLFEIKEQKIRELSSLSQSISAIHLKSELEEIGWTTIGQIKKYFNFDKLEVDFVDIDIPGLDGGTFENGVILNEELLKWWKEEKANVVVNVNKSKKIFVLVKNNNQYELVSIDDFKEDVVFGVVAALVIENMVLGFASMLASSSQRINLDDLRITAVIINQTLMAIQNILIDKKTEEFVLSEERNRLAGDLHDNTAQLLAVFLLQLSFYKKLSFDNPSKIIEGIDNLEKLIANVLVQSYRLIFPSDPTEAEQEIKETFFDNLRKFVDDFYNKFSLKVYLDIKGDLNNLPTSLQIGVLSIIREALYNVAKHAQIRNADVKVSVLEDIFEVIIRDNGCGFDLKFKKNEAKRQNHFGLLSMEERSKALGGSIIFKTEAGKGTEVVLTLPFKS